MTNWFTSDLHLNHSNIIRYCHRPFSDVSEMNDTLIRNWNEVVKPKDTVYVLGDFAWGRSAGAFRKKLNGRVVLILGNHDRVKGPDSIYDAGFQEIHQLLVRKFQGIKVTMCHYALRVWPGSSRKDYCLYGHSHGTLPGHGRSCDVGVDSWDYYPVSFEALQGLHGDEGLDNQDMAAIEKLVVPREET
jgi:calcineurin-like phosphoesterase family protein